MKNVNEFTEAVFLMKDELSAMRKTAEKSNPIPFMQQRVRDRASAASRFQKLSPEERRKVIEQNGVDAVMQMLRGKEG